MRLHPRGRAPRRPLPCSEQGFTLVELLTTIVIMGLVVTPLSIVMTQALTLVPESSERTKSSTDADRLVRDFSNDVANANLFSGLRVRNMVTNTNDSGSGTVACSPTAGERYLILAWWTDQGLGSPDPSLKAAAYRLRWVPQGAGITRVEVVRSAPDRVSLTGYCRASPTADPQVARVTITPPTSATREHVQVELNLRDRRGASLPRLVVGGTVRAG
jgi:prepilin-type N-terminal cleavage/methylation domain-containing protein